MNMMELIFFPSYFGPCTGQDIFHSGAVEFGQVLVDFFIREESLTESVDYCLLVAEWVGDLLSVETFDVVSK